MARITDRIDRITRLTDEYARAAPPIPRSVKIELTARCDFQCFFCAARLRLRDKGDIDPAFFRRVLAEMRPAAARRQPRRGRARHRVRELRRLR